MISPDQALLIGVGALERARAANALVWPEAVAMLGSGGTIWCSGLGKSAIVADKLAATLRSFGRSAHRLHPVDALHGDSGAVRQGDVLVAISASGRTPELLRLAAALGLPTLAITTPGSPLGKIATVTLDGSVAVEAGGQAPLTSFLVATGLADALALGLCPAPSLTHPGGTIGLSFRTVAELMLSPPMAHAAETVASVIPRLGQGAVVLYEGGVFTDGDLRRAVGRDVAVLSQPVGDVATREPVVVAPTATAAEALRLMEDRASQLSVLPVYEHGRCVGLLRLHDLVRAGLV